MSNDQPQHASDEIDLLSIFAPLWREKWGILLVGVVFAVIVATYQMSKFAFDEPERAQMQVYFNFDGAANGLYPNKSTFSPQELIASSVLAEVYRRNINPTESFEDFKAAFSLTPGFMGTERLETLVSNLASKDKGLSVAEFNEAVDNYTATLRSDSRTLITLTLNLDIVSGDLEKARIVLTDIAETWASQALNVRGVNRKYRAAISSQLLSSSDEEPLIFVNVLSDNHALLAETVKTLRQDTYIESIKDPASGLKLAELSQLLETSGKYEIAILKEMMMTSVPDPELKGWFDGFRSARLGKLIRQRDEAQRIIDVYDGAMQSLANQNVQNTQNNQGSEPTADMANGSNQTYAPQYGDDLVNTLLTLGAQMSEPAYKKELLDEKIRISSNLQRLKTEIELYTGGTTATNVIEPGLVSQRLQKAKLDLIKINDALTGITDYANTKFTETSELYELSGAISFDSDMNKDSIRTLALKLILGFILGCFLATLNVWMRALRVNQRADGEPTY